MCWDVITNISSIVTIVSAAITTYSAVKTKSYSEKIEEYSKKISNEYAAESLTIASQYTRQAKEEYYSLKKHYFGDSRGYKKDNTPSYLTEIEKLINQALQYTPSEFKDIKRSISVAKNDINSCINDYKEHDKFNRIGKSLDDISEAIKDSQEQLRNGIIAP